MNIVFSTDLNYLPHMGVALTSILINAGSTDKLHFYILENELPEEEKEKILSLRTIRSFDLSFIRMDDINDLMFLCANSGNIPPYITPASFFRLKIGSLLPDIDRAIYLDCDLIVRSSLRGLWDLPLEGMTVGAAEDFGSAISSEKIRYDLKRYFNSGVILFDLKQWRSKDYEREIPGLEKHVFEQIRYGDQSLLNIVLKEDVRYIDTRWNFMPFLLRYESRYSEQLMISSLDPWIVHFAAGYKPWIFDSNPVMFSEEYWNYRKMGPWKSYDTMKRVREIFRHTVRHPRDTIIYGCKKVIGGFPR
ncbi:MAG: glycosyltransferase family 8 protein [Synergistales bacterium]|nr:glycosyltransferase family 8 protein [Synergistales bacterium]